MEDPVIHLSCGVLQGKQKITSLGLKYFSFLGIRYGEPPLGPLRFKAPVPAKPWSGIYNATKCGSPSLQGDSDNLVGDEDCLFLNIFIPHNEQNSPFDLFPVVVYFVGGGYIKGSSSVDILGPEYFMENGSVILITCNHRLGPLGFCNLETEDIPGNAGVLDLILVLRWINKHIVRFRGDPDNITVLGSSIGAYLAHLISLSPLAKGLIHKLILQSGCSLSQWAILPSTKSKTIRLAQLLGYDGPDDNLKAIAKFLNAVPAEGIVRNMEKSFSSEESKSLLKYFYGTNLPSGYPPELSLLNKLPEDIIQSNDFETVPTIIGCGTLELGKFTGAFLEKDLNKCFENNPSQFVSDKIQIQLKDNPEKLLKLSNEIRQYYLKDGLIPTEITQNLLDMFSDIHLVEGLMRTWHMYDKINKPIYVYLFDRVNPIEDRRVATKKVVRDLDNTGRAFHGYEMSYLFKKNGEELNAEDKEISKQYINIITHFAKHGVPPKISNSIWKPFSEKSPCHLAIDQTFHIVETEPLKEKYVFWNKIYEQANEESK